jgi:hypothetical protein
VLPPGWRHPVRHGTAEAIKKILDEVFGRLGKGQSRTRWCGTGSNWSGAAAMADRAREKSASTTAGRVRARTQLPRS